MSTAIERVEAAAEHGYISADHLADELIEVLRLAKLGERVEQCEEVQDFDPLHRVAEYGAGWNDCLAWIRGDDNEHI